MKVNVVKVVIKWGRVEEKRPHLTHPEIKRNHVPEAERLVLELGEHVPRKRV